MHYMMTRKNQDTELVPYDHFWQEAIMRLQMTPVPWLD